MSSEAFEKWASQFNTESNEYIDKGADEFFDAGYKAGSNAELVKAAEAAHREICILGHSHNKAAMELRAALDKVKS